MDKFITLIENIVSRKIAESSFNKSIPCVVREVVSENKVVVESLPTGSVFTVPNWSGSPVNAGEKVQVFYHGNLALNSGAYIGASLNKEVEIEVPEPVHVPVFKYVQGNVTTGGTLSTGTKIAEVSFKATKSTQCFAVINTAFVCTESGGITFKIVLGVTELQKYTSKITAETGKSNHFSLTFPIGAASYAQTIKILCCGSAYIENASCFVFGADIESGKIYDNTAYGDYIYTGDYNAKEIAYYIGKNAVAEIPQKFSNVQIKNILATSFDHSDVERVKIPEGVTEIE